jgi:HAD superfamily hydrolase (TIGR01509 family)
MRERLHLNMAMDDIITEIKSRVIAHYEERLPLLPGAIEAVHTTARGYRIALASGSPTEIIQRIMQLTRLEDVFEFMVYGDDQPNGKPAPDIYLETARLLRIPPQNCVGIEDSSNGVRALKAAGMKIIAAPSPGFTLPDDVAAMANRILPSLEQFSLDLVRGLEA